MSCYGYCDADGPSHRPYRFFFYAGDRDEPEHVHVESGVNKAKFWLDPVRMERSGRFSRQELSGIQRIQEHQAELVEAWREFFQG